MASVTIRDVAKHAGVGVGTVSRVINGGGSVSKTTRAKVLDAIATLDFTPNQTARRLSLGKTHTVGIIVPFLTYPSYIDRLRGIEAVFSDTDYDFLIFNGESPVRRKRYMQEIVRGDRFDGIILMTISPTDQEAARLKEHGIPCILIEGDRADFTRILVNNVYGGYQATRYLIDQGHRRIGYLTDYLEDEFESQPKSDRFVGYCQALEESDIPYRPEYVVQGAHGRNEGCSLALRLLDLPEPPTAIFSYSDTQAFGVLEAARLRSLSVPDDLSVIGYDDIEVAQYLNITTVSQSLYQSGVIAAQALLQQLEGKEQPPTLHELPTQVVVRGTVGPVSR